MSYKKAGELLHIAMDIASRHYGMLYAEIDNYSSADKPEARRRNTQRLVKELEGVFGTAVETREDDDGKRVFITDSKNLALLQNITRDELAAFDHAIKLLEVNNQNYDADRLCDLRKKMTALAGQRWKAHMLTDYEYLVESNYIAETPGPKIQIDSHVVEALYEALTTGNQIVFDYYDHATGAWNKRHVHPQGMVVGRRHYLIGITNKALHHKSPVWYRLDRMANIEQIQAASLKDENFNLEDYAKRAYGAFYAAEEYQDIEWRFAPEAAKAVQGFRFHPDQTISHETDGSVTIRFKAAGWYEMVWALYPWGDKVKVIKPAGLAKLIEGYQRSDIPVLP